MYLFNIPYSINFCEAVSKLVLDQYLESTKQIQQSTEIKKKSQRIGRQKIAVISPSKIIVAELWQNFRSAFQKKLHNKKIDLRIFSYSELDKNLDIFCPEGALSYATDAINYTKQNNLPYILSEFQTLTILEQIFKTVIMDSNIITDRYNTSPLSQDTYLSQILNNILRAVEEYYHYNIDLSLLQYSLDSNEQILYKIIVEFDKFLVKINASIKAKYRRSISDSICNIIDNLDRALEWRIYCIQPPILIPYIQNFIIKIYQYFQNKNSLQNKGSHDKLFLGSIILHGLDNQCSDKIWAKIDQQHQQYVVKTLLHSINIKKRQFTTEQYIANLLDDEIQELFLPYTKKFNKGLAPTSVLNFSILSHKNRNSEFFSIAERVIKYSLQNSQHSICIIAPEAEDCDKLYHYLLQAFYKHDKKHQTNLIDKLGSYIPCSIADNSPLAQLLLEIMNYLNISIDHSNSLQKVTEKWLILVKNPKTFFYNKYGREINDLENFFSHQIFTSKNIEKIISNFANFALTEINKNTEEFLKEKFQKRYEFLEKCELFNSRLEELQEFINSTSNKSNILSMHLGLLEYLLGDIIEENDQIYIEKVKSLSQSIEAESSTMLINYSIEIQISNASGYKKFLHHLLHKRQFYRNETFSKTIKICTPADILFCKHDLLIATHMEEGKFPRAYKNHGFILNNTRRCSQKTNYNDFSGLEIGYASTSFANFLSATEIVFTYSGENNQHIIKNRWLELLIAQTMLHKTNHQIEHISIKNQIPTNRYEEETKTRSVTNIALKSHIPSPTLEQRPSILSSTAIEKLIVNPYVFFIDYIIKLTSYKKNNNKEQEQREFGIFVHKIIQILSQNRAFYSKSQEVLYNLFSQAKIRALKDLGWEANLIPQYPFWETKLERIVYWLHFYENKAMQQNKSYSEYQVAYKFSLEQSKYPITCTAILDKFYLDDKNGANIAKIIDYKTGKLPSRSDISSGKNPQLALQALLLQKTQKTSHDHVNASYIKLIGKKDNIAKEVNYIFDTYSAEIELLKILKSFYIDLKPYQATKKFFDKSHAHLARNIDPINK